MTVFSFYPVVVKSALGREAKHGRQILLKYLGMEILVYRQDGFSRKIFQLEPALHRLVVFLHRPALVVKLLEDAVRVSHSVEEGGYEDFHFSRLQFDANQPYFERFGIEAEPAAFERSAARCGERDYLFVKAGFQKLANNFPPFVDSGAEIRLHCQYCLEEPESRVASVEKHKVARHQIEKQFVCMLSFVDILRGDHGGDGQFVQGVEQLGYASHGRRLALFYIVYAEMLGDLANIRQPAHGSVFGDQAESVPKPGLEATFEKMDKVAIQFDESGEFQLFASFAQCGFRDALFDGFPSAYRLEKKVQLHLVRVFRDVY